MRFREAQGGLGCSGENFGRACRSFVRVLGSSIYKKTPGPTRAPTGEAGGWPDNSSPGKKEADSSSSAHGMKEGCVSPQIAFQL